MRKKNHNWEWIVCAGAYLPDFNAGANRALYVLLVTLGISLFGGIIVILWFSKKLTRPILQVAHQANSIACGNYSQETIEATSKDEIGELVSNFNIMKRNQKLAEEQIRHSEAFLQSITTNMGEGMLVMDLEGRLTFMNPKAERLLQWTRDECVDQNLHNLIHFNEEVKPFINGCLNENSIGKGGLYQNREDWITRKDGSVFPVSYVTSPLYENGNMTGSIIVFRDISKQKKDQERIEYMAFHDDLTKLPNRRYVKEKLKQAMLECHSFTLLMIDIDRFKQINEALGHVFGDLILQIVANRLKESVPSGVFVGRLTGDEFVIAYPCLAQEELFILEKQIREKVNEPMQVKHHLLNVSVTIGGAMYPDHGTEDENLLKHANLALNEALHQHVPFLMYEPSLDGKALDRLVLENHLHYALKKNELYLVYQPQVDIEKNQIQGVEALLRWQHPKYGLISPAQFIPIAEETGLMIPIGEWVLQTACRQLKEWHDQGLTFLSVSVNLSSRQFYSQDLAQTVKGVLDQTGLPPESLELEITESLTMNMGHALDTLKDLKKLGCKIAIDDFGTGYSSLSYLKHLPIDRLKIDRTFVMDLAENEQDAAIVSTIISMAQHLQLEVIAEGVETTEQREILRKKQCTHIQGYLYSPPIAPEKCLQLLRKGIVQ